MENSHVATVEEDVFLTQIVQEYYDFREYIKSRTKDPDNFLSITEFENRLMECIRNTSESIRNASSGWIRDLDTRELNRSKKGNG